MKNVKNAMKKSAVLLLSFVLTFTSCSMIDADVQNFFKEYTETAAIEKMEISGTYPVNSAGITCLPSDADGSITFYLRNPQMYTLQFDYQFDDSETYAIAQTYSNACTFGQSADKTSASLTFSSDFLKAVDSANSNTKEISGVVTITESKTLRSFQSYKVTLHANSVPPAVQNLCFQQKPASVTGGTPTYYVCFYIPYIGGSNTNFSCHQYDTRTIYFNGEKRYFNSGKIYKNLVKNEETGEWDYSASETDGDFSYSSWPGDMKPLTDGGYDFKASTAPAGYSAVYYDTGIAQSTSASSMEIKIEDDEGLSSSVAVSSAAEQLSTPVIVTSEEYAASTEDGMYSLTINHPGITTTGTACGTVYINYTISTGGSDGGSSVYKTGTAAAPAVISVPVGTYTVKATASKDFYLTSDAVTENGIEVKTPATFYVNQNYTGETSDGSKVKPYKTIPNAITAFEGNNVCAPANNTYSIVLLSDINYTGSPDSNNAAVSFTNAYKKYLLNGGGYTLTVNGAKNNELRAIYNKTILTVKNLTITGGYITESQNNGNGSAVYTDSYLTMENVTVTGNNAVNTYGAADSSKDYYGAAIYAGNNGSLKLTNCTITENTTTTTTLIAKIYNLAAGIYNAGNGVPVLSGCTITDNTAKLTDNKGNATGYYIGAGIYSECNIQMSGSNNIYDNKKTVTVNGIDKENASASNLFLPSGKFITVEGALTGSHVGVSTSATVNSSCKPVITSCYGTTNSGVYPSTYFFADVSGLNVSYDNAEALLEPSSSDVVIGSINDLTISYTGATTVTAGTAHELIFSVTDSTGAAVTPESYSYTVKANGTAVTSGWHSSGNTITLERSLDPYNYVITFTATCNGEPYATTVTVSITAQE